MPEREKGGEPWDGIEKLTRKENFESKFPYVGPSFGLKVPCQRLNGIG